MTVADSKRGKMKMKQKAARVMEWERSKRQYCVSAATLSLFRLQPASLTGPLSLIASYRFVFNYCFLCYSAIKEITYSIIVNIV